MNSAADLRVLLASQYPVIAAASPDEVGLLAVVRQAAGSIGVPVWTWTAARGLARDGHDPQYGTADPRQALAFVRDAAQPGVYIFADAHHALADPVTLRSLKDVAQTRVEGRTIVVTGPTTETPPELAGLAVPWAMSPPDATALDDLVSRALRNLTARGLAVDLDRAQRADLVVALRGLSATDASRLLQRAVLRDGRLGPDDMPYLRTAKMKLLDPTGALDLVDHGGASLETVGGLDGLKEWIALRGRAEGSERARALGIDPPRGLLLTGIPGCGKSLVARSLAATWDRPLLLLDPARLYGRFVGESEQRLEQSLRVAEAMAPAVLWIDEVEKGFATGSADGGVSTRLLGTFLRWLQERPDGIFVAATANDVSALPPELLRKGRFDEIFFVDLPADEARRAIFFHHLRSRGHDPGALDLDKLVEVTSGFSGAEIEAVVVASLYRAFAADAELCSDDLVGEVSATVPLSISRAEDVAALRAWAKGRARRA